MKSEKVLFYLCLSILVLFASCKHASSDPEPVSHTITYELNNGSWIDGFTPAYTYVEGNTVELPDSSKLYRENYDFEGWYDNDAFQGEAIQTISTELKDDITVYAKWKSLSHSISYYLNGGSWIDGFTPAYTYVEGNTVELPDSSKLYRVDYDFEGWYDNGAFQGEAIQTISTELKKDITVYAKWKYSPSQSISLANNYTPTLTYNCYDYGDGYKDYYIYAQMPDSCRSSEAEIYKYGFYIDDECICIQKSRYTYFNYYFTQYVKSLTPGRHVIMVTVEIFDVPGSYSSSIEFEM